VDRTCALDGDNGRNDCEVCVGKSLGEVSSRRPELVTVFEKERFLTVLE
jgi:hypothetical protein